MESIDKTLPCTRHGLRIEQESCVSSPYCCVSAPCESRSNYHHRHLPPYALNQSTDESDKASSSAGVKMWISISIHPSPLFRRISVSVAHPNESERFYTRIQNSIAAGLYVPKCRGRRVLQELGKGLSGRLYVRFVDPH